MEIAYSRTLTLLPGGRKYRNPRHFTGAEPGVTAIWLSEELPDIAEAYLSAGAVVHGPTPGQVREYRAAPLAPPLDPAGVVIPDDWADLGWQGLRALANQLTAVPVINKAEAAAVIEAEIVRRTGEETEG